MRLRVLGLALGLIVSGCGHGAKTWVKPGAGTEEFTQARYACLQQGQQPYSAAYINRYGGSASGGMTTNEMLFSACMEAGGWAIVDNPVASSPAYTAAIKEIENDGRARCRNPDYYAYFAWAPCNIREATPEQMADRTRVTAADKAIMTRMKPEQDEINARLAAAHRQYSEKYGEALARNIEQMVVTGGMIRQEYLDGKITRGEYNKRRRELAVQNDMEAIRIIKGI